MTTEDHVNPKCPYHELEEVKRYCSRCKSLVCIECITDIHNGHEFLTLEIFTETKLEELSQIQSNLQKLLNLFSIARDENKRQEDRIENAILNLREWNAKCTKRIQNPDLKIADFIEEITKLIDNYNPNSTTNLTNGCSVSFTHEQDLLSADFKAFFSDSSTDAEIARGSDNDCPTPDSIVEIVTAHTIPYRKFFSLKKEKNLIVPTDENHAWIGERGYNKIDLVSIHGKPKSTKSLKQCIQDVAATRSGELLISTTGVPGKIKKILQNGDIEKIYKAPVRYSTLGITVTENDCIIVGLHSSNDAKLVHLTPTGKLLGIIQYDGGDGRTSLFTEPRNVSSNRNGDILVIDGGKKVLAISKQGKKKFVYQGPKKTELSKKHQKGERGQKGHTGRYSLKLPDITTRKGLSHSLKLTDLTTDKNGNIFVSDYKNSVIHVLDKNGKLLNFVYCTNSSCHLLSEFLSKQDRKFFVRPNGLSVDKSGKLWMIGDANKENSILTILKYGLQ